MKNKLSFNTNIFIETMRQLKVTGIISAIIMAGITILRTISIVKEGREETYTFAGMDCIPWLIISFILITPIFMFQAFHFMDKRNSSDLYHSLPHTRGTIFISVNLAIMAWAIISILSAVIPSLLSALFFPNYMSFEYGTFFIFILNNIASCILVSSAISIAKSLSGTILNGIILSGIIIFLPRFMMTMIISILEVNPLFSGFIGNIFTESALNPVTSAVFSLMGIDPTIDIETVFTSVPSIIYGIVLGIIYFVIGGFTFCRRNSETASKSAPNKYLQAAYRIIIALILSSFFIFTLFENNHITKENNISAFDAVTFYIFVIFVYLLYELITTKKLKNLIRALPGLGIVAVLNLAMYFGFAGAYTHSMNFRPAPDEINSVTMVSSGADKHYNYYNNSISYSDYVLHEIGGLEISDKKVIEDVADALDKNISMAESGINRLESFIRQDETYMASLEINTNGKSKGRNVALNSEQYADLSKAICSSEKFHEAWMTLPALKDISEIYLYGNSFDATGAIYDEAKDLYSEFVNEIKKSNFETWFNEYQKNNNSSMYFELQCVINGHVYYMDIPVLKSVAPDTAKKCYEAFKERQLNSIKSLNDYLSKLEKSNATFSGDIYLYGIDSNGEDFSQSVSFSDSLNTVYDVLNMRSDDYFDYEYYENDNLSYIEININFYDVSDPELDGQGWLFTFPADEQIINKIKNIDAENKVVYEYED